MVEIYQGDNLKVLKTFSSNYFRLIYIDPPFNTRKTQKSHRGSYTDRYDDFCKWIEPRLEEARRVLTEDGSIFVHMDFREVHYVKVMMDRLFGRDNFQNEIIWAYDYGGRSKRKWSSKHDNILWYSKNYKNYVFNYDDIDRIPYMSPGLVGKEKAARGKTPTDTWWNTVVPTNSKERTGYPTQKPLPIIERIIKVHSEPGDKVLDFFCGSGTFGEAALKHHRDVVLIDENPEAIKITCERLSSYGALCLQAKCI